MSVSAALKVSMALNLSNILKLRQHLNDHFTVRSCVYSRKNGF